LDRAVFMGVTLGIVLRASSRLTKVVSGKFAARPRLCAALCGTANQAVNLSVHQDPRIRIPEISMPCHSEAASVVQQVHTRQVLSNIENPAE
jgi:hypothetical protein